ncbi:hypothetical protein WA026_009203 [Henosepilachna vigintioctopunctata]|uniref:Fatty acid desaturase domain-containing protein n=2 Tax=Henosepilachna vigintioctopunctata TaxID=420089 RepID=A0AAW1UZH4_9CUCU
MFCQLLTNIFPSVVILYVVGEVGITAGLHRLWTHRAYKAKWPLRLILMISSTLAFQGTIYQWSRDHRVHHKHSDTIADPHNINNGFFFAHYGWLMCKKYPEVTEKGALIDMDDILNDPIAQFQRKHIRSLVTLLAVILPTIIPMILWKESFICSFSVNMFRYFFNLHLTLCVNSVAHILGNKPYNKNIHPVENKLLSFFVMGEAFHNYHHSFPWDYKTAELGGSTFNISALIIEQCAKIGWAYDLKTTSPAMVKNRCLKSGDGSHQIWGWGDKDQSPEDLKEATITYRKVNK